jgi:zinc D-Ala-D-Ala carboxypeptidase
MYKPKYFSLFELVDTSLTDVSNNIPGWNSLENLLVLCEKILDPLREAYGKPLLVNSGYRSNFVNEAVGGVSNSQHKLGCAADISVGYVPSLPEVFDLVQELRLPFDQLIYYKKRHFIHISWSPCPRSQVIVRNG